MGEAHDARRRGAQPSLAEIYEEARSEARSAGSGEPFRRAFETVHARQRRRTDPRPPRPGAPPVDPGADPDVQDALERLRARSQLWEDAHPHVPQQPARAPDPDLRAVADILETELASTGLGEDDPIVRSALEKLRAHSRDREPPRPAARSRAGAPAAPAAEDDGDPSVELELGEVTGSASLKPPRAGPDRPAAEEPGPARGFCERLARRAAGFRARIGRDREIGIRLSPVFGEPLYVDAIEHDGPDMIVLSGSTKLGVQVQVVQHVSQANVWFVAMPPRGAAER